MTQVFRRLPQRVIVGLSIVTVLLLAGGVFAVRAVWREMTTPDHPPVDTVFDFLTATFVDGDPAKAMRLVCDESTAEVQEMIDSFAPNRVSNVTFEDPTELIGPPKPIVKAHTRGIRVLANPIEGQWIFTFNLEVRDREWRICEWHA